MTGYEIIVDDHYNGGEPSLQSGYTVSQVVMLLEGDYSTTDAAERLEISKDEVEQAIAYYEEHELEIDEIIDEKKVFAEEYSFTSA